MNKKTILYILLFPALLIFGENAFSYSGEIMQGQTVREMQENINALEKEKTLLEFKWNNFKIGNTSLGELLKADLNQTQQDNLVIIVEKYDSEKKSGEKKLNSIDELSGDEISQRRALLLLKKDFYLSLKPYISEDKLALFLSYIETDLSLNEKTKDVDAKIIKIQGTKQQRLQDIQGKIEDNNKILRESIENKISTQIKNKLDIFVTNTNFEKLPNESKVLVFNKLIEKLEYESIRLANLENSTSIVEEKIVVFRVMIDLLKDYTYSWANN